MVLAFLIAILIPLLFFFLIWSSEIYATSRISLIALAFGWGLIGFSLAFLLQDTLISNRALSFEEVAQLSAPFVEESLKAALLLYLLTRRWLYHAVDASVYGFAIGTSFAIIENFFYISQNPQHPVDVVVGRVISTNLMHAFNTGFVGAIIGLALYHAHSKRALFIVLILSGVMFVHFAFNQIALQLTGPLLIIFCACIGVGGLLGFIAFLRYSLKLEREAIKTALEDNTSAGEVAAALDPEQLSELLYKQKHKIGEERIKQIQEYLVLKSQLALLHKALKVHHDRSLQDKLQHQAKSVSLHLNAVEAEMGLYTWLWLRSILPSEESEIWLKLDKELNMDNSSLALLVELAERREHIPQEELEKRIQLLQSSVLFAELDEDDLRDIVTYMEAEQFSAGEMIIKQGSISEKFYILNTGRVAVTVSNPEGDEKLLWEHTRGEVFGHFSILDLHPYPAKVYCLEAVEAYALSRNPLISLIYAKPQIAISFMQLIIKEAREGSARLIAKQQGQTLGKP